MEKQLTAAIAGCYMGAEIEILFNGVNTRKENPKVNGFFLSRLQHNPSYSDTEYRLILTPLAKIADEDAIEVAKLVGFNRADDDRLMQAAQDMLGSNHWESCYPNALVIHLIDFLRSKHYDCGYSDIPSLIVAGLAVEKTNI